MGEPLADVLFVLGVDVAGFANIDNDGHSGIGDVESLSVGIPNPGVSVPKNKQDVGKRLAQWALAKTYGLDVVPSGPLFEKMVVKNGKARIHFSHIGKGLIIGKKEGLKPTEEIVIDSKLERFAIAGKDKIWVWAEAVIDGDTVLVSHPDVPVPVAVRYAYSANPLGANLYNREGFPASPFRTDDW